MLHRRVIYLLILAAALLFQVTNQNYLAYLLLTLTVLLPVLSLILSLPGMIGCRLSLSAAPAKLRRGEQGVWRLAVQNRVGLPLARLDVRLETACLFTGAREKRSMTFYGLTRRRPAERRVDAAHCGVLELSCARFRVWDYLGLFSWRLPAPESVRLLVEPVPADPGPLKIPEGPGVFVTREQAGRRGPGEDYELREYRPGDPLRRIHWKLSLKWDELIVREPSESVSPLPLLTFDHFGLPEEMDRVLDRLTGYSRALLALQRPHAVLWLDPSDASPCRCAVSDEKDLRDCLMAILSQPCAPSGQSILERPELFPAGGVAAFHIHVAAGKEGVADGP